MTSQSGLQTIVIHKLPNISQSKGKTCPLATKSSITQAKEKWNSPILRRPDFQMIWRCHGILCVHFYFCFLFRSNFRTRYLRERLPPRLWEFFSKVIFGKLPYHSYVEVYLFSIARHNINSTLKDTLRLKIFWT